ncbi:MAG: hypothetical protein J6T01_01585 [Kiritimatiellae bacterium]|nr:hypothetical protein [Kiritimatiellia bacterium]
MKKNLFLFSALALSASLSAAELKARVIQPPYAPSADGVSASFKWLMAELDKCDASLDLIVLPEFSDVPARTRTRAEYDAAVAANNAPLLEKSAATAKRCGATLFVNAIDKTDLGPRNTTFAFDKSGSCVGRYYKRHVTAGERNTLGFDVSYTREWSEPYTLTIGGVKYAFLTCYDFYFFESFSAIARAKPDVVVGCSLQRSDRLDALEFINAFCAYNTGAYLVRASVSLGEDSPCGGSSMVVAPTGKILGNLKSHAGTLDISFDPKAKYLKPAGFGNPPATHPEYVEIGRRPWQYRPAGPAIVPGFDEAPAKRLCAHRGFSAVAPENSLPAIGAAVALGASEVEFDLWWTTDGEIVSIHDGTLDRVSTGTGKVVDHSYVELLAFDFGIKKSPNFKGLRIMRFDELLAKFSCHTLMNIHVKGQAWREMDLKKIVDLIYAYDAQRHVYFMTENGDVQDRLARLAPEIPRCMGFKKGPDIVDEAVRHRCRMVQLFKPYFDEDTIKRAHAAGLRVNVFWSDDPEEAKRFLEMGVDTILTNDYQPIAAATGLK